MNLKSSCLNFFLFNNSNHWFMLCLDKSLTFKFLLSFQPLTLCLDKSPTFTLSCLIFVVFLFSIAQMYVHWYLSEPVQSLWHKNLELFVHLWKKSLPFHDSWALNYFYKQVVCYTDNNRKHYSLQYEKLLFVNSW